MRLHAWMSVFLPPSAIQVYVNSNATDSGTPLSENEARAVGAPMNHEETVDGLERMAARGGF